MAHKKTTARARSKGITGGKVATRQPRGKKRKVGRRTR